MDRVVPGENRDLTSKDMDHEATEKSRRVYMYILITLIIIIIYLHYMAYMYNLKRSNEVYINLN